MERLEQLMQIYHTVYLVCLLFLLIFGGVTVFLAFKWRIWEAVGILSGRNAMKALKKGSVIKEARKSREMAAVPAETPSVLTMPSKSETMSSAMPASEHTMVLSGFGVTENLQTSRPDSAGEGMQILEEIMDIHTQERV